LDFANHPYLCKGLLKKKICKQRIGSSFKLEWTGSNIDVVVEPTLQPLIAKLQIKNTSWHRQFVQLHKAKGGALFKVYATAFATALLLLLISGFTMAWQMLMIDRNYNNF
jgi:hypothetical protein